MPIYEYKCGKCGHFFEKLVFAREKEEEIQCPSCGAVEAQRQMSAAVVSSNTAASSCSPSASSGFS
jgi:putative FmdB family regulatory protein